MSAAALDLPYDALRPRAPDGLGAGAALAVLVHLLLVAALAFSVNWHAHEPEGVVAELWSAVPQVAAPQAAAVPAPTAPTPQPERRAAPAPEAAPQPPSRLPDAQISIERARREAARVAAEERDALRRQEQQREAQRQALQHQRALTDKAALEQAQRDAARREQLARDAESRQKREQAEKAEKERRDEVALQAQREANLRRIQGDARTTSEEGGTGTAARSAGLSAGYAGRIKARIKPNIVFTDSVVVSGTLVATVEVRCAPDGTIMSRRLLKTSGSPTWDEAVLRAIDKTEVLPRDTDGRVPPVLHIEFRPRE
jgi:colicin import membrane protein